MSNEPTTVNEAPQKKGIRWEVFGPTIAILLIAATVGIVNNDWLAASARGIFYFSLSRFGWLYQLAAFAAVILTAVVMFTKVGDIRFGGKMAKPKYSFSTWFAMSLIAGIAVGLINWGINEPIIHFSNMWGELEGLGITPGTPEAARFAMGRVVYHWTLFPYAIYALAGLMAAYVFYNQKRELSVTSTLSPLLGNKITSMPVTSSIVNSLCVLGIAFGLMGGLGTGLNLVLQGMRINYGVDPGNMAVWIGLGALVVATFITSSYTGIDKGIKKLSNLNKYIFYALLLVVIVIGPTGAMLNYMMEGLNTFFANFFVWGLDPGTMTHPSQGYWWTLFNWAIWMAYAPIVGIFLAKVAYGRTIRQFLVVNWIMPSIFGLLWFSILGGTALHWQITGVVDMVGTIESYGAVAGAWTFYQNLPFNLNLIMAPAVMFVLLLSFSTAADSITHTIAALCMRGSSLSEEPPAWQKVIWGLLIGVIAITLGALAGGTRGIDGVRQLGAVGGFAVLFVFSLQVLSMFKTFFIDKPTDNFEPTGDRYTDEEFAKLKETQKTS